ncbi:hydantoinase/oxoprolinase family protein [Methyloceanibacter sp.]|uniref:hydantoinase/oxoprolinase family protein n=1 Tax=Methyloceanibacter sp. TaxID=1965321 RepID=UPI003D6DA3C6
MTRVIGWDLGGANIKLACVDGERVVSVAQIPCPIIPERRKFDAAVEAALPSIALPGSHAVTMTGELSDVFNDRVEGVAYLVDLMVRTVGAQKLLIYAGRAGFLASEDAKLRPMEVASANFHATASLVARHHGDGLLVDVGTTTTDLISIKAGKVAARGATDAKRLTEGELLYTGVVRTPVMAVARSAPFRGRVQRIAAERFATMADVWRLAGDLPDDADPYPTADQRGKSPVESAGRLARMLGRDAGDAELAEWIALARYFGDCQLAEIEHTARNLAERDALSPDAPVIGAGCGRFIARRLAERLGRPYFDFADMLDVAPEAREMAARCAPAVAVALLASTSP